MLDHWESRRRNEVLRLFEDHVYGRVPDMEVQLQATVDRIKGHSLEGKADIKEVKISLTGTEDTIDLVVLIFLPRGKDGPYPLFLGLNFFGNHTVYPDPSISLPSGWLRNSSELNISGNRATDDSRGVRAGRWPVELILERGFGLATLYCGDIDPDEDDGFHNGVHGLDHSQRDSSSWGTLAAWAWGLSRVMDYLETDADVDASRVALLGHSRLGKTALWAGALDERFAMVVSNNSGCGGAALSRRRVGESVARINASFPHWFALRFRDYSDNETACPVDQHMLLGLVAPRLLYVASATEDTWADPQGEYLSLYYAGSIFALYGKGRPGNPLPPEADDPRWEGNVAYHIRTGKHDITRWDWEQYLAFADLHMKAGAEGGH